MTITCGFELEVSDGGQNVLAYLLENDLTEHDHFHVYHCDCGDCEVSTRGPLFKAQEDCTADGEFITRILEYGSLAMDRAIVGISRALLLGGGATYGNVGNHVHVSHAGMDDAAKTRMDRLFARYEGELLEIAAASHDQMRSYNGSTPHFNNEIWKTNADGSGFRDPCLYKSGHKLEWKRPTVEFRLWNSTRAAWRIRTHVGLSVAMVLAATAGVTVEQDDKRCVEDTIGDFIDAPTWAGILRQRYAKGGICND